MLFNDLQSSVFIYNDILLHKCKGNCVEVKSAGFWWCVQLFILSIDLFCVKKVLLDFDASVVLYWQCIVLFASLGVISQIIFPYNEHIANIVSLSLSTAHHPDQLTQGLTVLSAHSNNESSVISQCATHTDPSLHLFHEFLTLPLL